MTEFNYIDTDADLAKVCQRWQSQSLLALDTEFMRTRTFHAIPALFQVQAEGELPTLIDPVKVKKWQPFVELFSKPEITFLLHSASEDLELFQHFLGRGPATFLDTQVGAALTGRDQSMSLQRLVMDVLAIHIPKGETRSDWLKRPLSAAQKEYAALDVVYLPAVYRKLRDQLTDMGRLEWWQEDGARALAQVDNRDFSLLWQRVKSANRLDHDAQAALQAICAWREEKARELDKPRGWVLKDGAAITLAKRRATKIQQTYSVEGLGYKYLKDSMDELLATIADTLSHPERWPDPLPGPANSQTAKKALKAAKASVTGVAGQLQLSEPLLSNKQGLEYRVSECMAGRAMPPFGGWRGRLLDGPVADAIDAVVSEAGRNRAPANEEKEHG